MSKIKILVICKNESILEVLIRLINNNESWEANGAIEDEAAINLFIHNPFNLVLLGSGISKESEENLINSFKNYHPDIKIIQHLGGGSGLLSNEITAALENNKNGNFNILDNNL